MQQTLRENRIGPVMRGYIYHFAGGDKDNRIEATWWKHKGWRAEILPRTRSLLRRLPADRPLLGAEIGVAGGENAAALLQERPLLRLMLVDRWAAHDAGSCRESGDPISGWTNDDWRIIQCEALARLAPHYGRYEIVQHDSVQAARLVEDHSLDFVFIDGDHSYRGCRRDLEAWMPKVRPSGWLCGHDYGNVGPSGQWNVKQAVAEFASALGLTVATDVDDTWSIEVRPIPANPSRPISLDGDESDGSAEAPGTPAVASGNVRMA